MGDEVVGEIRFLTIDGNLTTMTAPIVPLHHTRPAASHVSAPPVTFKKKKGCRQPGLVVYHSIRRRLP